MVTKKINIAVSITSWVVYLAIVFYLAILLSNILWWICYPGYNDFYVEKPDINAYNNSTKYIINRYPFGEIMGPAKVAAPSLISRLKLTGVYVNTPERSIAFLELDNKPFIATIGSTIEGNTYVKSISGNAIVIADNKSSAEISLNKGTGNSNNKMNQGQNQPASYNNNAQAQPQQNSNAMQDFAARRQKLIEEFAQQQQQGQSGQANQNAVQPPSPRPNN